MDMDETFFLPSPENELCHTMQNTESPSKDSSGQIGALHLIDKTYIELNEKKKPEGENIEYWMKWQGRGMIVEMGDVKTAILRKDGCACPFSNGLFNYEEPEDKDKQQVFFLLP